jgi:general secretion pathway protein J
MADMRESGFTLIEVLIALAITAFVAAASYTGISSVLSGAEQLRLTGERTRDINRAMSLLDRDLRQFSNRPVRDEFGQMQPALAGGPMALFPLSLTREGWHNSLGQPRSELQRVHYYLEEGSLWRGYYISLDRAVDAQKLEVEILSGVSDIELRFLESLQGLELSQNLEVDTRSWRRNWFAEVGASTALPAPPEALELRLVLEDLGEIRRLYALPPR